MIRALLLSNSTLPGTEFFTWPRPYVKAFLGNTKKKLVFIPFAAVTFSFDEYEEKVKDAFADIGHDVISLHRLNDKINAIEEADGIVTGGGNSFALLHRMYEYKLIEPIQTRVRDGLPYIGWSAGANLGCPTIMTTNDMPIVHPPSLHALNIIPVQINPHYHEMKFEGQGGETRKERLEEFIAFNAEKKVIGLPEGMLLERNGKSLTIKGAQDRTARLYENGKSIQDLKAGQDLSFLLA